MMIYFEIQVDNLQRAADFYGGIFGWKFEKTEGFGIEYWHITTPDGGLGGMLKRPAKTPPKECGTNAFVCSFEVDNFDKVAARIESAGGIIAMPKFPIAGRCWQGYFLDPDNNTFGIFEVDENAGK